LHEAVFIDGNVGKELVSTDIVGRSVRRWDKRSQALRCRRSPIVMFPVLNPVVGWGRDAIAYRRDIDRVVWHQRAGGIIVRFGKTPTNRGVGIPGSFMRSV